MEVNNEDLTEEQEDMLDELDNKFYNYEDDLTTLQIEYIKANLNEFK